MSIRLSVERRICILLISRVLKSIFRATGRDKHNVQISTGRYSRVIGYSNVQLLYSDAEAILSDVLVRYMTCKTRRISRQPYSAFDMGDFRVLATA